MVKKGILLLIVVYIFFLLGFYFFQNKILFQSKRIAQNYSYSFKQKFEEVHLKIDAQTTINAIHFKVENPRGVILYFHGNKDNLIRWGKIASILTKYGYDVFVMDYRGYGKSTGKRVENLMYEDAQRCYEFLKLRYNEDSIVVYGRSLGGAFATYVASQNTPKQLILEATFSSLNEVLNKKMALLPTDKLLNFKFNTVDFMEQVKVPTLIFHGRNDGLVPIELAEKLYSASNKEWTEFRVIDQATHHNIMTFDQYNKDLELILEKNN